MEFAVTIAGLLIGRAWSRSITELLRSSVNVRSCGVAVGLYLLATLASGILIGVFESCVISEAPLTHYFSMGVLAGFVVSPTLVLDVERLQRQRNMGLAIARMIAPPALVLCAILAGYIIGQHYLAA